MPNQNPNRHPSPALPPLDSGRLLIRTMRLEPFFTARFMSVMDKLQRSTYFSTSIHTWQSIVSNLIAFGLSIPVALIILVSDSERAHDLEGANNNNNSVATDSSDALSSSDAALALTYAFTIPFFMLGLSLLGGTAVVMLTSVERLLQYADKTTIPQEPAWRSANDLEPGTWPSKGAIVFEDASLVYKPGSCVCAY